jgi:hypothetical protein
MNTKMFFLLVIVLLTIASCSQNYVTTHRYVQIGMTEDRFLEVSRRGFNDMVDFKPSYDGVDEGYHVYRAYVHSTEHYLEKYIYLFNSDTLEYYAPANKFAMHKNPAYRAIAQEEYDLYPQAKRLNGNQRRTFSTLTSKKYVLF